ncbi:MAG: hypothetical protein BWY85_00204 [Firmicutes bacterium ADurb.Bin506]|nr:MAG: hypothetical protein BWY85_00204 [Firmicutes bacterium ADurb.Bin506]
MINLAIDPDKAPPHVREMAKSDVLFELGIVGSMKFFHACYKDVRLALDIALVTRPKAEIALLRGRVSSLRLRRKLVSYERKYPMILRFLLTESYRTVGERFGISHAWVGKIAREFGRLAVLANTTEVRCVESIEREARDD